MLHAVSRALKPGGYLLFDTHNQPALTKRITPRSWYENSRSEIVLTETRYDVYTGRMEQTETTIHQDGSRSEQDYSLRVYTCPEIIRMLESTGMSLETVYGSWDGSDYTPDSRAMIVVARKET